MHNSWAPDRTRLSGATGRSRSTETVTSTVPARIGVWHTAEDAHSQATPGDLLAADGRADCPRSIGSGRSDTWYDRKTWGGHPVLGRFDADAPDPRFRLTPLGGGRYGLSLYDRNRWDPLPYEGTLNELVDVVNSDLSTWAPPGRTSLHRASNLGNSPLSTAFRKFVALCTSLGKRVSHQRWGGLLTHVDYSFTQLGGGVNRTTSQKSCMCSNAVVGDTGV